MIRRHFKDITIAYLPVFFLMATFVSRLEAEVYDYEAIPGDRDTYTTAKFRIYVPDTVAVIRGVYLFLPGTAGDSRYVANSTSDYYVSFRAFLEGEGFAFMGAQILGDDAMDMGTGSGNAVLGALDTFAVQSAHPELEFAPIFLNGHSWGGQFSYHFTIWKPERVLGFMTHKGGRHGTSFAGFAVKVPGYMFVGENDLDYRTTNLPGIFESHRPFGALWILAIEQGAGHGRITDRNLLDNYFKAVIQLRLPAITVPGEPIELQDIDESIGWLGNLNTFEIGKYACYDADRGAASWIPSKEVAQDWQAFVSNNTVTDTIQCLTAIALSPDSILFGQVAVGDTAQRTFEISNLGTVPLKISDITSLNELFTLPVASDTIPPLESRFFTVVFVPDSAKEEETLLTITSDDPVNPSVDIIALGVGAIPQQTLSTSSIDFGIVQISESRLDTFYVRNIGSVRFPIVIIPPTVEAFSVDTTAALLEPGDSLAIAITFAPPTEGTFSDIIIVSNLASSDTVTLFGNGALVGLEDSDLALPQVVTLYQNYPNPFNLATTIKYALPQPATVQLSIFNLLGEEVALLVNEQQPAGYYHVVWNASNIASGLYFYRVLAGEYIEIRKMALMK